MVTIFCLFMGVLLLQTVGLCRWWWQLLLCFQKDTLLIEGVQRRATISLVSKTLTTMKGWSVRIYQIWSITRRGETGLWDMDTSIHMEDCETWIQVYTWRIVRHGYKYTHGPYSVNKSLLKMDIETITRGHWDVPACVNILFCFLYWLQSRGKARTCSQ